LFPLFSSSATACGGTGQAEEANRLFCNAVRSRSFIFGIQHWDVEPDIVTMAKGIANGFPMGNMITTKEITVTLVEKGLTISTFGGNPVSCAASLATIEVMEDEADPKHVAGVGARLRTGLEELWYKYPLIGDARGKGLMLGVELVSDRDTKEPVTDAVAAIFEQTRARGLLIGKGGLYNNVLRVAPPLTAADEHVDDALKILDHAFAQVQEEF
jgi:4-aminobutyrate aminotransferase